MNALKVIFAPVILIVALLKVIVGLVLFVVTGNMDIVEQEMHD